MWITKDFVMNDFAAEVKKGKYKKIDYPTWRELKESPDEWDINVEYNLYNYSEENSHYATISWDGCGWCHEFYTNDGSLGEYIKTLLETHNIITLNNSSAFSNAISKASEAAIKAGKAIRNATAQTSNWTIPSINDWTATSVSSNYYKKQPTVEITEKGLKINEQTINEIIDDATGVSIRKENNNMTNLIKGFNFGSCENDNVKMSMYGIAVKNANGTWVSYDAKSENVVDVDVFSFDAKYLYKMPVAIKDVKAGDTIIHCRTPVFVTKNENGKILCVDPAAAEEKIVLPVKNIFGFDFVVKIVNLFDGINGFEAPSADQPFGNNLWMFMMLEDKGNMSDFLPLMLLSNKENSFNPLMFLALSSDKTSSNDLLPLLLLSQNNPFGQTK